MDPGIAVAIVIAVPVAVGNTEVLMKVKRGENVFFSPFIFQKNVLKKETPSGGMNNSLKPKLFSEKFEQLTFQGFADVGDAFFVQFERVTVTVFRKFIFVEVGNGEDLFRLFGQRFPEDGATDPIKANFPAGKFLRNRIL